MALKYCNFLVKSFAITVLNKYINIKVSSAFYSMQFCLIKELLEPSRLLTYTHTSFSSWVICLVYEFMTFPPILGLVLRFMVQWWLGLRTTVYHWKQIEKIMFCLGLAKFFASFQTPSVSSIIWVLHCLILCSFVSVHLMRPLPSSC